MKILPLLAAVSLVGFGLASTVAPSFAASIASCEDDVTINPSPTAGSGTCLAVLAGREADAAVLGYEMAMLVKSVRPYLMTAPRQAAAEPSAMP